MLKFSQATGFVVTTLSIEQEDGEDTEVWRERAGYGRDATSVDGTVTGEGSGLIHYYKQKKGDGWLVDVESGNLFAMILVDNEAELFALRVKISAPILASVADRIESVATIAEKAFQAWHGHASYRPCAECDPESWERDKRLQQKSAARDYVKTTSPAISGFGGHAATFAVARKLVQGFALSDSDVWTFLLEYNKRCEPPWSEAELRRKLEEARAVQVNRGRRGGEYNWGLRDR